MYCAMLVRCLHADAEIIGTSIQQGPLSGVCLQML